MRRAAAWGLACVVAGLMLAGCGGAQRAVVERAQLVQRRAEIAATVEAEHTLAMERLAQRLRREQLAAAADQPQPGLDVLILSGGGDYGAFAAGFLTGWARAPEGPWRRPSFDVVNGVSTGALIAPFVFAGDPVSFERIMRLYGEPKKDWLRLRGLFFFLPGNESFFDNKGLADDIAREVDDGVIAAMARGFEDGRILGIGATNLDLGRLYAWNLADVAYGVQNHGVERSRIHKILLASSAIPGAFPPVEIDGMLFADGGITSNILYSTDPANNGGLLAAWDRLFPGVAPPPLRYWIIINNQLQAPPETVQPRWTAVSGRSLSTAIRSATTLAVRHLAAEVALLQALGYDAQLRFVAIPDDWVAPKPGAFQRETMQSLIEIGQKLGADPASWRDHVPGPAGVFRMPTPLQARAGGPPAGPATPQAPPENQP